MQTKTGSLHNEHDNKNGGNVCHINFLDFDVDFSLKNALERGLIFTKLTSSARVSY